jgi:hypothetical protein
LIAISRNVAPFDLEGHYYKMPSLESGPSSLVGAPERPSDFDRARQVFLTASGKWRTSDVACSSKKSTIVISVEGLNSKALEEAADEIHRRIE